MKILLEKYVAIATGEAKGKIFQIYHYHPILHLAYFPGPPEQLIPVDELELINMPFPYWRKEGGSSFYFYPEEGTIQCDTLPINEQIKLCRLRILRAKTFLDLHERNFKANLGSRGKTEIKRSANHLFYLRELEHENQLLGLLERIVPPQPLTKEKRQKLLQEYIAKNPDKTPGANIATSREQILQTTQPQEKLIFAPTEKLKKKPGRPRGAKNVVEASGWLDIKTSKDGTKTFYYCYKVNHWTDEKISISSSKFTEIEQLIKDNYPVKQIIDHILGGKVK